MIILDTHIWLRWLNGASNTLPSPMIERIESAPTIAVSAISCWEVAWLARKERLKLSCSLDDWFQMALLHSNVQSVPVDQHIATFAAGLPEHHPDPADRLIIATAIQKEAYLISMNSAFPAYAELQLKGPGSI
jgi:PIN domain nuclease of toxin-antitoxin system